MSLVQFPSAPRSPDENRGFFINSPFFKKGCPQGGVVGWGFRSTLPRFAEWCAPTETKMRRHKNLYFWERPSAAAWTASEVCTIPPATVGAAESPHVPAGTKAWWHCACVRILAARQARATENGGNPAAKRRHDRKGHLSDDYAVLLVDELVHLGTYLLDRGFDLLACYDLFLIVF